MTVTTPAPRIDIIQFSGKEHVLGLIRSEYQETLRMVSEASETEWDNPTPCDMWQVRDLVGHLLDVSFSYAGYFKQGERGWPIEEPRGMRAYGEGLGKSALLYHDLYKWEALGRLDACNELLFGYFDKLTEEEWGGRMIPHKWVGPVPAFMMAAFQLMDYSVHNWDFRKALGQEATVHPEAANTIVPFMFGLLQLCFAPEEAADVNLTVAVELGDDEVWTVRIADGQLTYEPGRPAAADATFAFGHADFCLDVYQRIRGGQASGDPAAIETFRKLFFTI
jgi:uncharacterized protein (TIGR03083 family)